MAYIQSLWTGHVTFNLPPLAAGSGDVYAQSQARCAGRASVKLSNGRCMAEIIAK